MTDNDALFRAIAEERRSLADLLDSLSPEQWEVQSLCQEWTVRGVAAHVVLPLITPMRTFMGAMLRAKGNFNKANLTLTGQIAREHRDELPGLLRDHADSRFTPPGSGPLAPLTDIVIHGQDIRRPLGLTRDIDPERLRTILDFLVTPAGTRGFRKLDLDGTRWEATDCDWGSGNGAVVSGPGEAIMLYLTGRAVASADLSGEIPALP